MQNNVRAAPDLSVEMLNAEFWISRTADANELLLTTNEINAFNHSLVEKIPGHMVDIFAMTDQIEAGKLRRLVDRYDAVCQQELFVDGKIASDSIKAKIVATKNCENISDTITVRYALITGRCNMRSFPTNTHACRKLAESPLIDRFQETHLEPGQPALIFHTSTDGLWLFAQVFNYCGWVERAKLALFDRTVWHEYCERYQREFLVVSGKRLYIAENYCADYPSLLFSMGARLPLWYGEQQEIVDLQNVCGSYTVAMPRRQPDGSGCIVPMLIPLSSDVAVGNVPFTGANLLRQAFKMLGERYGWGGLFESWDCSGLVVAAYSVFGFNLPRNCAIDEQPSALIRKLDFSENDDIMNKSQKLATLIPGGVIFTPGHVMIYLGSVADKPYVIHSTSGGRDSNGNILNCVLVANLHEHSTVMQLRLIDQVYAAGNYQ